MGGVSSCGCCLPPHVLRNPFNMVQLPPWQRWTLGQMVFIASLTQSSKVFTSAAQEVTTWHGEGAWLGYKSLLCRSPAVWLLNPSSPGLLACKMWMMRTYLMGWLPIIRMRWDNTGKRKKSSGEDSTTTLRLKWTSLTEVPGHTNGLPTQNEKLLLGNKTHISEHQLTCQILPWQSEARVLAQMHF